MLMHLWQDLFYQDSLFVTHSFHDKAPVVAEEEETSRGTRSFTGLEDLVAVGARVQRLLNLIKVDIVHGTHPLKDTGREGRDLGTGKRDAFLLPA